jgi:hypothetical protein
MRNDMAIGQNYPKGDGRLRGSSHNINTALVIASHRVLSGPPRGDGILFGTTPRMALVHPTSFQCVLTRLPVMRTVLAMACALLLVQAAAQSASNLRWGRWALTGDTLVLDTLSIVPGSLHLFADGLPVAPAAYELDPWSATLMWRLRPVADTVTARYRTMPLMLGGTVRHKDRERLATPSGDRIDPFEYVPPRQQGDLIGLQGLDRRGSISRGVLFGNNQDLSVNSTLNLELSGRLTDRINVLASVTDNNIPIQAGGNTLELQDFDQVFVKVFEDDGPDRGWSLIAGDFVLQRPKAHFLTYLKKTKGLSFDTRMPLGEHVRMNTGVSAAISKGKFARNVIQGIEGVQGPYRLRGNDGELFIVVLSGTERVFIDGQPLVRGQENDYVIDYNTAELTFTARRMITKDRRITVEFQYSDKNYARSLVRVSNAVEMGKSTVRFELYSEQDHKNRSLQQELGDAEREVLRLAGDDPLAATINGADSTGWAPDQVLYRETDSLGYAPVYVYSTDPAVAVYRVTFTQVGGGQGDYVQHEFTPNGRVFRWVAPDTVNGVIVRRGDHLPLRVLIPPRSQQLLTLGLEHRFSSRTKAGVELAYSSLDRNTFSSIGSADDGGYGIMLNGEHAIPISGSDTTLQLVLVGEVESISKHFQFVERYRAVEFERNWNLVNTQVGVAAPTLDNDQLLAGVRVGVRGRRLGEFHYGVGTFQVPQRYSGWKQDVSSDLRIGRTTLSGTASWLNTFEPRRTDFLRNKAQVKHTLGKIAFGLRDEHERNLFTAVGSDSLVAGSYAFNDWELFVQSADTARNKWRLTGGQRQERVVRAGSLARSTTANAFSVGSDLMRDPRNRLSTSFTYRQLRVADSTLTTQRPEDTYLTRVDYDVTLWKGFAVFDAFYEFGSGLEQRREYIYLEVPAGQGLYVWIDYNGDGVKDLNEFELAAFGYEANYLRVFVPSNTYVRTFSNQFSTSLDLRPAARWGDAKGVKRFVAKFSDMASLRVDRKTATSDLLAALDPTGLDVTDTTLMSYASSARNTFYYDRTGRKWSVDHTYQNDRGRTLLLNGFESRSREMHTVRLRWNTTRHWTADVEGERGRITNSSDLLVGRTYAIDQQSIRPRITWQPNTSLRAMLAYKYTTKQDHPEVGGQEALLSDLGLELRYNTAGKGSVSITANWVDITYAGEVNSSLANEMLGGLKPGTNITWSVSIQRNLNNNLQVDLTYNGRRSENVPVIHVGGAQVRAFF